MKATRRLSSVTEIIIMGSFCTLSFFGVYVMSGKGPQLISWAPDTINAFLFVLSAIIGFVMPFIIMWVLFFARVFIFMPHRSQKIIYVLICTLALWSSIYYYRVAFSVLNGSI